MVASESSQFSLAVDRLRGRSATTQSRRRRTQSQAWNSHCAACRQNCVTRRTNQSVRRTSCLVDRSAGNAIGACADEIGGRSERTRKPCRRSSLWIDGSGREQCHSGLNSDRNQRKWQPTNSCCAISRGNRNTSMAVGACDCIIARHDQRRREARLCESPRGTWRYTRIIRARSDGDAPWHKCMGRQSRISRVVEPGPRR